MQKWEYVWTWEDLSRIYSSKSLSAIHRLQKNCIFYWSQLKSTSVQLPIHVSFHTHCTCVTQSETCGMFHVHNSLWSGPLQEWQAPVCGSTFRSKMHLSTTLKKIILYVTLQHIVNNCHGRGYEVKLMKLQVQGKQVEGLRKMHFPC